MEEKNIKHKTNLLLKLNWLVSLLVTTILIVYIIILLFQLKNQITYYGQIFFYFSSIACFLVAFIFYLITLIFNAVSKDKISVKNCILLLIPQVINACMVLVLLVLFAFTCANNMD